MEVEYKGKTDSGNDNVDLEKIDQKWIITNIKNNQLLITKTLLNYEMVFTCIKKLCKL